jgi:putative phosphoribosyl transferase
VNGIIYRDRKDAGKVLAQALADARLPDHDDTVVLGLVRGGVPVAYEVATALGLPLDIMVVRKIGAPGNPELAMGAAASGDVVVLNPDVVRAYQMSEEKLRHLIEAQTKEIERIEQMYRQGRPAQNFEHRGVILVDDGLATGASMRAAIRAVRPRARRVTVAVPVGARSTVDDLRRQVDHVICALIPEPLEAVGLFYEDFQPTADHEVIALLADARKCLQPRQPATNRSDPEPGPTPH